MTLQGLIDEAERLGLSMDTTLMTFCECRLVAKVESATVNGKVLQLNVEGTGTAPVPEKDNG